MERSEAEAIYDAGREAVVEVLLAMDRRIQQLEARVEKLEREISRSSRNSSLPPSSDPPGKRRAARGKDHSGRSQGAQPGHEGHGRELLPICAVDEMLEYWPERCECGHVFAAGELLSVGDPVRHQVEELPVISARVIEHRCPRVRCPGCGERMRARLPADIANSAFGPRFEAAVAVLSVRNRISRRDVVELGEELFGVRLCAGTIADYPKDGEAQIAETTYGERRLIVRRTRLLGAQARLWPDWRHFCFITNRTEDIALVEAEHRDHAVVEQVIADLKDQALVHFPSGQFNANGAWTVLGALAHNLLRWTQLIGLPDTTIRAARTLRRRLITIAGRLTRHGRSWTLHLPARWPWQGDYITALTRIRALPTS